MTPSPPGKGLLGEKAVPTPTQSSHIRRRMVERMPSARHLFLTLLLGLLVTAGLANAVLKQQPSLYDSDSDSAGSDADHGHDNVVHHDDSTFSRLLSSASPQALHEFLHSYFPSTYKHGIYDSDHSAMEAVHATDPELATSIVQMAKRQQSGNDTTVPPTSTQATDSGALTSTSTLDQTTTTTQETSTTSDTTTTLPTSPSETSTVVDTSTTTSTSSTDSPTTPPTSDSTTSTSTSGTFAGSSTGISSGPAITVSPTTASSSTSTPTIPITSSSSSGSSSRDSTLGTTSIPSSISRATRTSTFTSTLPGGAKTTITSVEVVTPGAPEQASTTSGSSGSLQTGLAPPAARKPVMMELVIGAVVGGALLV